MTLNYPCTNQVLAKEGEVVYIGAINEWGQYSHEFSNIQRGSGDTSTHGNGDCDYVTVTHRCVFGKSRFYELQSCMVDTYGFIRNLEPIKDLETSVDG